jgi:di/tripeptidase
MRFFLAAVLTLFLLGVETAGAAGTQVIELNDGSTITGEVVSLANGVYTVKSNSLGTIQVEAAKVRAIRAQSSGRNSSSQNASSQQEVKALQDKMMNDKEIMALIQSLQNDPDFKKALEDPALLKAVNEGDIATLTANPAFMKLLNNATVRQIEQKATR